MFLTQRLACPCGSIISGQRRERVTKMAFSTESVVLRQAADAPLAHLHRVAQHGAHRRLVGGCDAEPLTLATHACVELPRNLAVNGPW